MLTWCTNFFAAPDHCAADSGSLLKLLTSPDDQAPQCDIPLSGEAPEVDAIVQQAIARDHRNLMSVADSLYQLATDKLVGSCQCFWVITHQFYHTTFLIKVFVLIPSAVLDCFNREQRVNSQWSLVFIPISLCCGQVVSKLPSLPLAPALPSSNLSIFHSMIWDRTRKNTELIINKHLITSNSDWNYFELVSGQTLQRRQWGTGDS